MILRFYQYLPPKDSSQQKTFLSFLFQFKNTNNLKKKDNPSKLNLFFRVPTVSSTLQSSPAFIELHKVLSIVVGKTARSGLEARFRCVLGTWKNARKDWRISWNQQKMAWCKLCWHGITGFSQKTCKSSLNICFDCFFLKFELSFPHNPSNVHHIGCDLRGVDRNKACILGWKYSIYINSPQKKTLPWTLCKFLQNHSIWESFCLGGGF